MSNGIYKATEEFEEALAKYTGAPHAVAIDNCSNAIFLSLMYEKVKGKVLSIPSHTYPSVACSIINSGAKIKFYETKPKLKGFYKIGGTNIYDSALRFTRDMYIPSSHMCLSFSGPSKHLKLGKGGAILTDSKDAVKWFKRARFSGRREIPYNEDVFDMIGWNFYMLPEIALRGTFLMSSFYDASGEPIHNEDIEMIYPDLSKFDIYKQ